MTWFRFEEQMALCKESWVKQGFYRAICVDSTVPMITVITGHGCKSTPLMKL